MAAYAAELKNGATATYTFSFERISDDYVKVQHLVNGTWTEIEKDDDDNPWTLDGPTSTITMGTQFPAGTNTVRIYRETPLTELPVTFSSGSALAATQLNENYELNFHSVQEITDHFLDKQTAKLDGNIDVNDNDLQNVKNIIFEGSNDDDHDTTFGVVNPTADRTINLPNVSGTVPVMETAPTAHIQSTVDEIDQLHDVTDGTVAASKFVAVDANKDITGFRDVSLTRNLDVDGDLDVDGTANLDAVDIDGNVHVQGTSTFVGTITASGGVTGDLTGKASELADAASVIDTEVTGSLTVDNATYFTTKASDKRYFRQDTSETISSGDAWSSTDGFVATTAALDARIIDMVDDVGGFVPVDDEESFPTSNPDINNPATGGTVVSVKNIGTSRTPTDGVVTITDGAGSGNDVTINGCGTTVLAAGFGMLVETTATTHTYNFHRLSPKASEVSTVAGNSANVTTVANNIADINALEDIIDDIQTLAAIENNDQDDISDLAAIADKVTTCANNISDISTVADDLNEVDGDGNNASEINTVANSIANVDAVGGSIANVNTVADDIDNVNSFFQTYKVSNSAPGSPDAGDLWWDTSQDPQLLKAYDATNTQWIAVTTDQEAGLQTTGGTMTGAIILDDGRDASAPVLTFTDDTNTGIFSSGANSVDITTAGETKLQVSSTAVKSTLPTEVEVTATGTGTGNQIVTALTVEGQTDQTPAAGIGVGMDFAVETAANNVEIGAQIEAVTTDVTDTSEDVDLVVNLMAGGAAAAEKLRITSTGTVQSANNTDLTLAGGGSGKVIANDALDVNGDLDVKNGADIHTSINQDGSAHFNQQKGNADFRIDGDTNDNVFFVDASTEHVGIGDNTPDSRLHIKEQIDTAYSLTEVVKDDKNLLKIENPSTTDNAFAGISFRTGDGADMYFGSINQTANAGDFYFANQGSPNVEMMRIKSDGKVGIGTTSPSGLLHVSGQDTTVKIQTSAATLADMTNDTEQKIGFQGGNAEIGLFKDSSGNFKYVIGTFQSSTDIPLEFRTADRQTRIHIAKEGNVGIGETTPNQKLDVRGNVRIEDGNNLILQNDAENASVSINADDCSDSYNLTLPPEHGTAQQVLRINTVDNDDNVELEWATLSQDVITTPQAAQSSRTFATGNNYLMAGTVTIDDGEEWTLQTTARLIIA